MPQSLNTGLTISSDTYKIVRKFICGYEFVISYSLYITSYPYTTTQRGV